MRKTGNPFRSIHGRTAAALLLICALCAAVVASGVAVAGDHEPVKATHLAPGSSRAGALALIADIKATQKAEVALKKRFALQAAKSNGVVTSDLDYGAVVDGNFLFVLHVILKTKERKHHDDELVSTRVQLIRTDRTTAAKTTLINQQNSYPIALRANGGRVAAQTIKYAIKGDDAKLNSTIYAAGEGDPALTSIDSAALEIKSEQLCGKFNLLNGLSDSGEPLVNSVDATCQFDDDQLDSKLQLWKADGTRRELGPVPYTAGGVTLTGERIVMDDPYLGGTATRTLDDPNLKGLWHAGALSYDVAPDGTIAMIGAPEYHGCTMCTTDFAAEAPAPAETAKSGPPPLPGEITIPAQKHKFPFVVFPAGDAENPVLISSSRENIAALKFCGTNLYALEAEDRSNQSVEDVEEWFGGFLVSGNAFGRYEIQLLDTHGKLVRSLGKTKSIALKAYGCNGDRLVIASGGNSISSTEVGP